MKKLETGLSGCTLELIDSNTLRKYSSSESYNKRFKTKYNYIIPCNLYGEFDKFDAIQGHFVGALIDKIIKAKKKNEKHIKLFGDGRPKRQFMHAKDLAKKNVPSVVHVDNTCRVQTVSKLDNLHFYNLIDH